MVSAVRPSETGSSSSPGSGISGSRARAIVFTALMAAMSLILSRFFSLKIPMGGMEALRFGMGGLPLIASGLILGPVHGALTGACADILGMALFPGGPYLPQFTLTAALTGMIPAFLGRNFLNPGKYFHALAIVIVTQVITTCLLVPFFLMQITGFSFAVLGLPRLFALFIEAPFYAFLLCRLFKTSTLVF